MGSVLIELHVNDFSNVLEFYSLLGFSEHKREEDYLIMKKDESVICFYGGSEKIEEHEYFKSFSKDSKKGFGAEIIVFYDNIESVYSDLKDKVKVVGLLQERRWGARDFRVEDPFGFYLRLSQRYTV